MGRQGSVLSEQQVQKIVALLSSSDLTMSEIAKRMKCSKSVVAYVNRRFRVRTNPSSKRSE